MRWLRAFVWMKMKDGFEMSCGDFGDNGDRYVSRVMMCRISG